MVYQFFIPEPYRSMVDAGTLIRRGALLIDPKVGGIVAHLQETAGLAQTVARFANPVYSTLQLANLASGAVGLVQNEQIKNRIYIMQQMLGNSQNLQIATIAASVASIGVSAAGTALIIERMERLRADVVHVGDEISAFHKEWHMAELLALLDKAMTRCKRVGSASQRLNGRAVLEEAETVLHEVFDAFARRGRIVVAQAEVPCDALRTIVYGMTLAGDARVKALFMLDEAQEAENSSIDQMTALVQLTRTMPRDILAKRLRGAEDNSQAALDISQALSEARFRAASIPPLIESLRVHELRPSTYLAASEEEKEAPFMFLPAKNS